MSISDHNLQGRLPAAYIKVFIQHAVSEGLSLPQLLIGTSLDLNEVLQGSEAIGIADTRQVLANMARIMGPGWHLALANRLTISSHGPLGFAVVTAADISGVIDVLLRFFGIRAPFLWLAGTVEAKRFVVRMYESTHLGDERRELVELAMLGLQALIERPLGREIQSAEVALAYPEPVYHEQLAKAFHANLRFDAGGHMLSFPADWLIEPCALHDEAMHRYLLIRCEEDLRSALGILPAEISVRQALLARSDTLPGLKDIAASQNISPRTLIRRLKRGNTSYNEILEDVRKTLAVDYLLHSNFTVSSIAYRLGYQDPSNFGRAFRGWFGGSPGRFRAQNSIR